MVEPLPENAAHSGLHETEAVRGFRPEISRKVVTARCALNVRQETESNDFLRSCHVQAQADLGSKTAVRLKFEVKHSGGLNEVSGRLRYLVHTLHGGTADFAVFW